MRVTEDAVVNFPAIYARQLLRYGRGIALWEPAPTDHEICLTVVEVGDVGYIEDGQFNLLFNAINRNCHSAPYLLPDHLASLEDQNPGAVKYKKRDRCDPAGTTFASEGQNSLAVSVGMSG
jgi:hypothetical protein